jgi:hypothetical protein
MAPWSLVELTGTYRSRQNVHKSSSSPGIIWYIYTQQNGRCCYKLWWLLFLQLQLEHPSDFDWRQYEQMLLRNRSSRGPSTRGGSLARVLATGSPISHRLKQNSRVTKLHDVLWLESAWVQDTKKNIWRGTSSYIWKSWDDKIYEDGMGEAHSAYGSWETNWQTQTSMRR